MPRARSRRTRPARPRTAALLLVLAALAGAPFAGPGARAQEASADGTPVRDGGTADPFVPQVRPTLRIRPAAGAVEVDGKLGDAGWRDAAVATGFSEAYPDERVRPAVRTRVHVTYDEDHLYLAFEAEDGPGGIRASLRDRDGIFQDDFVGVMLDTFGDQTWAYEIFANPLGVQGDLRLTSSSGEDAGFDLVFESDGAVGEDGYVVEMAIPFASLRFPDAAEQVWRVNFFRIRPRGAREQISWAALDRDDPCFMCQWGTLEGLEGIRPGGSLELFPSLVANQSSGLRTPGDPESGLEGGDLTADPSLGIRYAFANGITAEATVNPDFSQVESDAGLIDANSTFALFFPERRPFFQEGSDLLGSWIDAIYTRSINDPQGAAKLTVRRGATSFAYVGARDERSPLLLPFEERSFVGRAGPSFSNLLRARHALGESSFLGVMATDRRWEDVGGSGTTFGADGLFRLADDWRLEWQLVGSRTVEPDAPELTEGINGTTFDGGAHTADFDGETYWGHAQYTSLEHGSRTYSLDLDYWAYSPTFRTDNGFTTRNDSREVILHQNLSLYPSSGTVNRVRPFLRLSRRWNWRGEIKETGLVGGVGADLAGQTSVQLVGWRDPERFRGVDFDDGWGWEAFVNSSFSDPVRLGLSVSGGKDIARNLPTPELADALNFQLFGTFKPVQRLVLEPRVRFARLLRPEDGSTIFSGYIFRNRASLQFTRELFVRLVAQYDEFSHRFDVEPLLTYKVNPFTQFFVGSTHRYADLGPPGADTGFTQTDRQYFAKIQYLLRI